MMRCLYVLDESPWSEDLGIRYEEPECGKDFCDSCGDCLFCYGDDPCYGPGSATTAHFWVKYISRDAWDVLVQERQIP